MTGTVSAMQAVANLIESSNVGYDQSNRWSFYDRATRTLRHGQEGDCSSVCGAILQLGGFPVDLSDPFYTRTFAERAVAAGFTKLPYGGLTSLQAGDFVLKPGKHVEFVYAPDTFYSASIDENGKAVGGRGGDQTGRESRFTHAYEYRGGWELVLRPPASAGTGTAPSVPTTTPATSGGFDMSTLPTVTLVKSSKRPANAEQIETIQALMQARGFYLGFKIDGVPGNGTLGSYDAFQVAFHCGGGANGRVPDRVNGARSWESLLTGKKW